MEKNLEELQRENEMLRREIKVAREAADITADFVVKQFEQTQRMLNRFQEADAERQAVLDAATQLSIIATDLDGNIQLFSRGAANLLGYKKRDMVGKANILSLHLPDELEHYAKQVSGLYDSTLKGMEVFAQYVKQKQTLAREWLYICQDGKLLEVNLSITGLYGPAGRMVGYLFTAMDLSSHKQLEYELRKARDVAEAANASKGDFLARMSHEIRTPMNGIIGMTHLLQKTELDPQQGNYADKLLISANTLLRLINDILDFSKIDAGRLEMESIPFRLEDVFNNITNVIGVQAERKGLEFLFHFEPQVPFNLIGDPLRLGQVLMNLASNAVKFTSQGEIVISVTVDERGPEDVMLRFTVRDSGIGLEPDQVQHLFTAFSQADDSITRKYGGTGLGLAICKELSEMMGGQIWVESERGQGSDFIFTSRFHYAPEKEDVPEEIGFFHGLKALVVDDNMVARDTLVSILTALNMKVDSVGSGQEAISCLEEAVNSNNPYDVVLLDWIMPGIDGIETAKRIKSNTSLAQVPAMLMVTANGREEALTEAEKAGLDAFLLKPVYGSVIYNTLLQILGKETVAGSPAVKKTAAPEIDLSDIQGARILLVDDNNINLEVATAFLHDAGVVVEVARNGHECLDTLEAQSFDLVLMDIQMPVMDGLEACRRIRQNGKHKDIPIIAMTAHAMSSDREKSFAAGMNDHISKPIDPLVLYRTLKQLLGGKRDKANNKVPAAISSKPKQVKDSLPHLSGINKNEALSRLNNNEKLFLSMLREFRRNFSALPTALQELSVVGNWGKIGEKAHTIKGVAGYIGATDLFNHAQRLEKAIMDESSEAAAERLPEFIHEIDTVLSSLAVLPEEHHPDETGDTAKSDANGAESTVDLATIADDLELLVRQLEKGELAAEEHFLRTRRMLQGYGCDNTLADIARKIDDIEFEEAAELTKHLLHRLQQENRSDAHAPSE